MPTVVDAHHRRWLGPLATAELGSRLAALPEADADTVVLGGELCREADLDVALARLRQRVGDDGRVAFVEHVGRTGLPGRVQAGMGAGFARLPWGCHVDRDVPAAFRRAGFVVTELERFTMPTAVALLRPWVRGIAVPRRRP